MVEPVKETFLEHWHHVDECHEKIRILEMRIQELESLPFTYDDVKNITVWRCITSQFRYGHWEYLFDDLVLEHRIQEYIKTISDRGGQRLTLRRLGPFSSIVGTEAWNPMRGTISIAKERSNIKTLESFLTTEGNEKWEVNE